jgi:hypothetical protein
MGMASSCATSVSEASCVTYRRYAFGVSEQDTAETLRGYSKLDTAIAAGCET